MDDIHGQGLCGRPAIQAGHHDLGPSRKTTPPLRRQADSMKEHREGHLGGIPCPTAFPKDVQVTDILAVAFSRLPLQIKCPTGSTLRSRCPRNSFGSPDGPHFPSTIPERICSPRNSPL